MDLCYGMVLGGGDTPAGRREGGDDDPGPRWHALGGALRRWRHDRAAAPGDRRPQYGRARLMRHIALGRDVLRYDRETLRIFRLVIPFTISAVVGMSDLFLDRDYNK